jgi:ABC-type bacteriocin/lantibiotic exporter with double-glycine peptidase domain
MKRSLRSAFWRLLPLVLAASLADAAMLYGIRFFMKIITGESAVSPLFWALLMVLMTLVRGLILVLRGFRSEGIFKRFESEMQGWFVRRLGVVAPRYFHEKESEGKLQSLYDATHILSLSGAAFMQTLQAVLQLLIFFPVLFWISTPLTIFLFLGILPVLVYMQKKMHGMGSAVGEQLERSGNLRSSVENFKKLFRSWSAPSELADVRTELFSQIRSLRKVGTAVGKKQVFLTQTIEAFSVAAVVLVLAFCAWMILRGWMNAPGLILYCSALFLCYKPVKECARMIPELRLAQNAYALLKNFGEYPLRSRERKKTHGLELENVNFRYAPQTEPVFSEESKTLSPGGHVLLQGANGAGKSTFLRLVAGLEEPDSGTVRLPKELSAHGIFLVSQEIHLPPVRLLQKKISGKESFFENFMEVSGAGKLLNKTDFSGGEKARVALLWALASPAKILLLDEPFAFIARRDRSLILSAFLECAREQGKWIVMASHEPLEPEQFAFFERVEEIR